MDRNEKKRANVKSSKSNVSRKKAKVMRAKINNDAIKKRVDFRMNKLTDFPIEGLHYELMLEMVNLMEPKTAIELVNVSPGFRAIVLEEPWRIVGRDVHGIERSGHSFRVYKFSSSPRGFVIPFGPLSSLTSMLKSCYYLELDEIKISKSQYENVKRLLSRLRFINLLSFNDVQFHLFSDFTGSVIDSVQINFTESKDGSWKDSLVTFVETSLLECKEIRFEDVHHRVLPLIAPSLKNTQNDYVRLDYRWWNGLDETLQMVQSIFTMEIPSQGSKALLHLAATFVDFDLDDELVNLGARRANQCEYDEVVRASNGKVDLKLRKTHCFVKDVNDGKLFCQMVVPYEGFNFLIGRLNGN